MPKSTEELENELKTVQTTEELMDWLDENKKKESFSIYLRQLCHQHETELSKLANEVALSKSRIYALANGSKNPKRDTVIKLAIGIGATVEETDKLLKLAGHKELYAKSEVDAIILYGIQNHMDMGEIEELIQARGYPLIFTDEERNG